MTPKERLNARGIKSPVISTHIKELMFNKVGKKQKTDEENRKQLEIARQYKRHTNLGSHNLADFFGISGVYLLYKGDLCVYIGESCCVLTTISQHIKKGIIKFDSFSVKKIQGNKLYRKEVERNLINDIKPILNIHHSEGKPSLRRKRNPFRRK